jgi:flagellar capping protein FliD
MSQQEILLQNIIDQNTELFARLNDLSQRIARIETRLEEREKATKRRFDFWTILIALMAMIGGLGQAWALVREAWR